jgi:hypothetical protein
MLFWITEKTLKIGLIVIISIFIVLPFIIYDLFGIGELLLLIYSWFYLIFYFPTAIALGTGIKYRTEFREYLEQKYPNTINAMKEKV